MAPDISGHSRSRDILPADISSSAERVAVLIRRHAHGGRAHAARRLSMAAFIAIRLSLLYPELVLSAVVTAGHPMEGRWAWITRGASEYHVLHNTTTSRSGADMALHASSCWQSGNATARGDAAQ
ncbi:hypothetical protein F66182_8004 [Fusarium sp. NRRL 66182]|nr:hypothetical protein F66182_8004 [Fusarium sp. NRRL 66182]